jgi:hypothetical protein
MPKPKPKPKNKGGRPTVLTPIVQHRIAQYFLLAFTDEQIAQLVGIASKTIQRARGGIFCPAIRKMELRREAVYRRRIWNGKGYWQGAAWFLERKYPTQFAKPEIQLQINNTIGPQTTNVVILAPAAARKLNDRSQTLEAEVEHLVAGKNGDSK